MKLNTVPANIAEIGLRAIKTACLNSGTASLTPMQTDFLNGIQKYILHTDFDLAQLSIISEEELANTEIDAEFSQRIVSGGIVAACIDGQMNPNILSQIEKIARALKADIQPIKSAGHLANHNLLLARLDIIRKSLPGVKIRQTFQSEGLVATAKQFFPLLGITLPEVTAKYKRLESFPENTLGKAFIHYLVENKFPFPGKKGAGPEIIVLHDCLHILGEYGTSAGEEIEIAAFQAGCQFGDFIYGVLFGLAQYHLDIQMAPVAASQSLQGDPQKTVAAFARGCAVNRDMWRDFNPWEHFHKPLIQLRTELQIPPKT